MNEIPECLQTFLDLVQVFVRDENMMILGFQDIFLQYFIPGRQFNQFRMLLLFENRQVGLWDKRVDLFLDSVKKSSQIRGGFADTFFLNRMILSSISSWESQGSRNEPKVTL
jgi:hypothetical protein